MKRWIITVLLVVCVMLSACKAGLTPTVTGVTGEKTLPTETTPTQTEATKPETAESAPTQPVPTETVSTESAPTEPAPTQPAPTEPAPTEPAPTEPAPTEPAPTQPAPTEPAPTQPAPTEPAPTEPAPTEPAPTEHTHSYTTIVYPPTCEEYGYAQHTCQTCGDVYDTDVVSYLGHDFVSTEVAPTCRDIGYTKKTCRRCGFIEKENLVAATGHNWSPWVIVKEPTYTEQGLRQHTCGNCGIVQEHFAPDPVLTEEQAREAILQLINLEREQAGLPALVYLTEAQQAADIRVVELRDEFSQTRPNGTEFFTVLQEARISYQYSGELRFSSVSTDQFRLVVNSWMSSQERRDTILDSNFKFMTASIKDNYWVVIFVG